MRLRAHRSTTFITIGLALVGLILVGSIIFSLVQRNAAAQTAAGKLITVYDRGGQQVFLSQAETVGAALNEAGIAVDDRDAVEPARDEVLLASEYHINIYRARPVTVIDGATRQRVVTPYQTPERIAADAQISLFPEDKAVLSRSDDIVSNGAGLQLIVDRAVPMVLDLYGKTAEIRTQASTVGDMLSEKAISLTASDRTSLPLETPITPGLQVRVWREGKQMVTVEEALPHGTEQIKDADRAIGYKEIKTAGRDGLRIATYEIVVENGAEVSRSEVAAIITQPAQTQVEIIGAKLRGIYTTPSENQQITWNYLIAQGFSREQTAGIMGNLMQEHRFNTSQESGGLGIVQWIGARATKLYQMAAEQGRDPFDITMQLDYLMFELNGGYARVKNELLGAGTIEQAVVIFQNKFEKCGICREEKRIEYAHNIFVSH